MKIYDFYFACPFFNPAQIEREESLIKILRGFGFEVFSPKDNILLKSDASPEMRFKCFQDNIKAIHSSKACFVVTDDKDVGTIWEAGFAYASGIKIIYFAETLGNNPFNVMLAESGNEIFTSRSQLSRESLVAAMRGFKMQYKGAIE